MNRATALLLAMATLLAHALAVHLEPGGRLGHPYDEAHSAFRLGRNLVHDGVLAWNPGESAESGMRGGLSAHPSPLLVAVSAVGERLYLPVHRFAQLVGLLAALLTVSASARFAVDRSAGVIPALLLVTSGAFAAAAASGTEGPLAALALTVAFVAFERRRPLFFAAGMALLVTSRVEGLVAAAVLAAYVLGERARAPGPRGRTPLWTLLPAAALGALLLWVDDGFGRGLYAAQLRALLAGGEQLGQGGLYLVDFLVTAVTPVLMIFPVVALCAGKLGGTGRRALLMALVWTLVVVAKGGGIQPYAAALVPALPLVALAVQQGILVALDTLNPRLEQLCWGALALAALGSALASKSPGELEWHAEWLDSASAPAPFGQLPMRGRAALHQELATTADLRSLGRFLREQVDPELSILTPWCGAVGYLAGRTVLDLASRATVAPGGTPAPPWSVGRRVDLLHGLQQGADLILPERIGARTVTGGRRGGLGIDPVWLERDVGRGDRDRGLRFQAALADYELVTIPMAEERSTRPIAGRPVRLLRRRALDLAPRLELAFEEGEVVVTALPPRGGRGHPQLVQLQLRVEVEGGALYAVDPRGNLVEDDRVVTRADLVLGIDEAERVELFRGTLRQAPGAGPPIELRARLLNPRMRVAHPLAEACLEQVAPF